MASPTRPRGMVRSLDTFWPHPPYAEDQPLAKTILTVHVIHRVMPIGAFLGALRPVISSTILKRPSSASLGTRMLLGSSRGVLVSSGVIWLALLGRMWGREHIEWQDRSWRILENKGQVQLDDWSSIGGVLGALYATSISARGSVPVWKAAVGGAGIGTLAGIVAHLGFKHFLGALFVASTA